MNRHGLFRENRRAKENTSDRNFRGKNEKRHAPLARTCGNNARRKNCALLYVLTMKRKNYVSMS